MKDRQYRLGWRPILLLMGGLVSAAAAPEAGRLQIPAGPPTMTAATGLQKLGGRDGLLYVPSSYSPTEPQPLLLLLHKAGGTCAEWFRAGPKGPHGLFAARAEQDGFIILAPEAPGQTWGSGGPKNFGYDHLAINHALQAAFARCAIDRDRLAIGGFSDGASYALSLGLANGDLFSNIVAFTPGYIVKARGRGRPLLFISHGGADPVLPVAVTSRVFVASLRKNGYNIDYREYGGGHALSSEMAEQGITWLMANFRQPR